MQLRLDTSFTLKNIPAPVIANKKLKDQISLMFGSQIPMINPEAAIVLALRNPKTFLIAS